MPKTLYDKIWEAHAVHTAPSEPTVLYIDNHYMHEVTSPQAFAGLEKRGLSVRRPESITATMDHSIPTINRDKFPWPNVEAEKQVRMLMENCRKHQIKLCGITNPYDGIVHVIGPELGLTLPGQTIVCGDSHTATHGAFGASAFGIGTSEVEHVMATQCLLQNKTKNMAINIIGELPKGVYAKDIILKIINSIGVDGGVGYTIEYRGPAIAKLSMEARMTICNMSIEAGARAGLISADETTVKYLSTRATFNNSEEKQEKIKQWLNWKTDNGAKFDKEINISIENAEPIVTWGTNPAMSIPINGIIPPAITNEEKGAMEYMGFKPGQKIIGQKINYVFIGSCTNGRIEDLRVAADLLKGRKIASGVRALIVPGSRKIKNEAEKNGLRDIFIEAGCEWRDAGCSMCVGMNGDTVPSGQYCASTSNRNFVGRQGKGARTLLMSPAMAAVAAIEGRISDAREYI